MVFRFQEASTKIRRWRIKFQQLFLRSCHPEPLGIMLSHRTLMGRGMLTIIPVHIWRRYDRLVRRVHQSVSQQDPHDYEGHQGHCRRGRDGNCHDGELIAAFRGFVVAGHRAVSDSVAGQIAANTGFEFGAFEGAGFRFGSRDLYPVHFELSGLAHDVLEECEVRFEMAAGVRFPGFGEKELLVVGVCTKYCG